MGTNHLGDGSILELSGAFQNGTIEKYPKGLFNLTIVVIQKACRMGFYKMSSSSFWVYILLCENNTYYKGYTNNLEKRYLSHVEGTGRCKYTRSFKPIKIAQSWEIKEGKLKAMQVERYIKRLSRRQKDEIVNDPHLLNQLPNITASIGLVDG